MKKLKKSEEERNGTFTVKTKVPVKNLGINNFPLFLKILLWALIVTAIISFIASLINALSLKIYFSNDGFEKLFSVYSAPLKILAVIVTIYSIGTAFSLYEQAKDQNKQLELNNRFNNYYSFRDKFFSFFECNRCIQDLAEFTGQKTLNLKERFFKKYFGYTFDEFNYEVNYYKISDMSSLLSSLEIQEFYGINQNLRYLTNESLDKIKRKLEIVDFDGELSQLIEAVRIKRSSVLSTFPAKLEEIQTQRFKIILTLTYTLIFYESLLDFVGEDSRRIINYLIPCRNYLGFLNIDDL